MKKKFVVIVALVVIASGSYLVYAATKPVPPPPPITQTINIYAYHGQTDRDLNNGQVGCSRDAILPLPRTVTISNDTIERAINLLLQGKLTSAERTAGYSTEFPNLDFKLEGVDLVDGIVTLRFTDVPGFTDGGSCRVGLLWAQIEKTAAQFPGVRQVLFTPETLFQP